MVENQIHYLQNEIKKTRDAIAIATLVDSDDLADLQEQLAELNQDLGTAKYLSETE